MLVSSAVSDSQSINVLHTHMSYLQASCQHAGTPLSFPGGHFESPQKLSSQKNQQQVCYHCFPHLQQSSAYYSSMLISSNIPHYLKNPSFM